MRVLSQLFSKGTVPFARLDHLCFKICISTTLDPRIERHVPLGSTTYPIVSHIHVYNIYVLVKAPL